MVMQPEPTESDGPVLPYRAPSRRVEGTSAGTLGGFSLLCTVAPIVGFAVRSGPMYLIGLPLSFVGLALGLGAIVASVKASTVSSLGIAATIVNGLSAFYFVWLFFVHGLC